MKAAHVRCEVLRRFAWLTNMYQIDYFVDEQWQQLPNSWRQTFQDFTVHDLANLLSDDRLRRRKPRVVLPLSFLVLRRILDDFSMSRLPIVTRDQLAARIGGQCDRSLTSSLLTEHAIGESGRLWRKVKRKKKHEIQRFCEIVALLRVVLPPGSNFDRLVDVGAGLGHFSRILTLTSASCATLQTPPLTVYSVEADDKLCENATRLDDQAFSCSSPSLSTRPPNRVAKRIDPSSKTLMSLIGDEPDEQRAMPRRLLYISGPSCVLGLHACGDLSATLVARFRHENNLRMLISIGCCYHKLIDGGRDERYRQRWPDVCEPESRDDFRGFPMSAAYADCQLPYAARELACHALERFQQQLENTDSSECLPEFRIQCYRAVLEWLIAHVHPTKRHRGLRSCKHENIGSFWQFARFALSRSPELIVVLDMEDDLGLVTKVHTMLDILEQRRMLIVYCLRLLIAPLIESTILDDRLQFLLEQEGRSRDDQIDAFVIPIFDPLISARNLALFAWKK